ncbi:MAG TPA: nucleoside-triphosphatase [Planctomycetota bacterium]|nr:nucleoside-triphosphatase [Planctomycetota bacterium]
MGLRLILWVGPKHSGKTTAATRLVRRARREGIRVAGVLSPSVYAGERLLGFDVADIASGRQAPLARREPGVEGGGGFRFLDGGLALGRAALAAAADQCPALAVADEFGPLELRGGGWREGVDRLLEGAAGIVLLVVREALVEEVSRLYAAFEPEALAASSDASIERVLTLLGGLPGPPHPG